MGLRDTTEPEGAEGMKGHLLNLFFQHETRRVSPLFSLFVNLTGAMPQHALAQSYELT